VVRAAAVSPRPGGRVKGLLWALRYHPDATIMSLPGADLGFHDREKESQ
jgi:hypothetical protein